MTLPVLTAVTGQWEAALVSGLEAAAGEVRVVRRCVDLPDLLAASVTGQARAVVVSAGLRRLDGAALSRLAAAGLAVVALVEPGDQGAERRLRQLGVDEVLPADAAATTVAEAVGRAVDRFHPHPHPHPHPEAEAGGGAAAPAVDPGRYLADPAHALPAGNAVGAWADGATAGPEPTPLAPPPGRLVAVWGPTGAPGRTTVAVTLAAELAALVSGPRLVSGARPVGGLGPSVTLVDADTYGGSVAQVLGLLDEAPGLAAAARAADHGTLGLDLVARSAPLVGPGLRVLTGISRPRRWPELRGPALARVFGVTRQLSAWTVVDCGFGIELDEELTYDTAAPRRNGATLAALEEADQVLAIGSADPVGLQRLVRGLGELSDVVPGVEPVVVVNRVRAAAVGGSARSAERRVRAALERYAGVEEVVLVPDDRPALDEALLAGRTLTEAAPTSPARLALAELAVTLSGLEPARGGLRSWTGRQARAANRQGARRAARG